MPGDPLFSQINALAAISPPWLLSSDCAPGPFGNVLGDFLSLGRTKEKRSASSKDETSR